MFFRYEQIPEFVEAVAREDFIRSTAFYEVTESIGPFEVVQMELRHLLHLQLAGNPLLTRGGPPPSPEELTQFLLILQPEYFSPDKRWRKSFFKKCKSTFVPPTLGWFALEWDKKRWAKKVAVKLDAACQIIESARKYIEETFIDHMGGSSPMGKSFYCDMMFLESIFAREYHRSAEEVMHMRVKKMFQALKEIKEYHALKAGHPPHITNRSDEALHQFALKQDQLRKN